MYKAIHKPSGQDITILDLRWAEQVDYLRGLDKKNTLVCPVCEQPVRVRAGRIKRWHFAHKHLSNCPYNRVSINLLKVRAALYEWLVGEFGENHVSIERILDSQAFHRPVDVWVESDGLAIPYWVIDRRIPPDERANLTAGFRGMNLPVHWVFTLHLLNVDQLHPRHRLHLTTTERAFNQPTSYDQAWQTHFEHLGGSLHYLDPDEAMLTTYRNLTAVHPPQLYTGTRLQHPLAEVEASRTTGEFIHPGEIEQYQKTQAETERRQQEAARRLQKAEAFFASASGRKTSSSFQKRGTIDHTPFRRTGTCRFCGAVTTDWVSFNGETGSCVCRECKDR